METLNNNTMKQSVRQELASHLLDLINEETLTNDNIEDWHFYAFNEDYYIIGYYQAEQWLKNHGISAFDAIAECQQYEKDNFGEITNTYDNAEKVVNMLAYIYGEELLGSIDAQSVEELKEALKQV